MSAILILLLSLLAAPDQPEFAVRTGLPITLDGTLDAAEWADAFSIRRPHPAGGEVELKIKRTGPWLALGVRGERDYQGETLWVYTSDASEAWVVQGMLGIGQPSLPPMLWQRVPPAVFERGEPSPGECARGCRLRVRVDTPNAWSAEYLLRLSVLGIGRADERDFRGLFRLVVRDGRERLQLISVPESGSVPAPSSYARLVSADRWGAAETWPPVPIEVSREFDDHELLQRLFLEHEQISVRMPADVLVITSAVRPRSETRIRVLRRAIEAGQERNPTLPAWRYFLGRLLHEGNLLDDARVVVEGIPPPLRKFDPFVNLAAEHYFDAEEFNKAMVVCDRFPAARGMRETRALVERGLRLWAEELRAIAADKTKAEKNPRIRIHVRDKGVIECELFEDDAPHAVRNLVDLISKRKYYDGMSFHDVQGGTLAAVGDPRTLPGATTEVDGPAWRLRKDGSTRPLLRGYLATVPAAGGFSHGSKFFIAVAPLLREMREVAVFGRVIGGLEIAERLEQDDRIDRIEIVQKRNHTYDPLGSRLKG